MKNSASGPSSSANLSERIERLARRGGAVCVASLVVTAGSPASAITVYRHSIPAIARGEIARGERLEIVDALADADEMHRQR